MQSFAARVAIIAVAVGFSLPATAQRPSPQSVAVPDCPAMWRSVDADKDGQLTHQELDKLKAVLEHVDVNRDRRVSQAEFSSACAKGLLADLGL